jgi:hypothetical protein
MFGVSSQAFSGKPAASPAVSEAKVVVDMLAGIILGENQNLGKKVGPAEGLTAGPFSVPLTL